MNGSPLLAMEINPVELQFDDAKFSGVVFIGGRYYEVQGRLAFEPVAVDDIIVSNNQTVSADRWISACAGLNHEELRQPNAIAMFQLITSELTRYKSICFGDTFMKWEACQADSYEPEGELNKQMFLDEMTFTNIWHLIARSVQGLQAPH